MLRLHERRIGHLRTADATSDTDGDGTFPGIRYEFETDATLQNIQPLSGSAFTADYLTAAFEILLGSDRDFIRGKRN